MYFYRIRRGITYVYCITNDGIRVDKGPKEGCVEDSFSPVGTNVAQRVQYFSLFIELDVCRRVKDKVEYEH